ncbi:hypothetical protein TNCV_4388141 [Trichonephila clavipes]|nr:hypothetical protein TNCV_4388141 [Trichonephila clavipes]
MMYRTTLINPGTVSDPYLVQITLTQLSMDEEANFPIAASVFSEQLIYARCPLRCCSVRSSYTKRDVLSTIDKILKSCWTDGPSNFKSKYFPPAFVEKQIGME